MSHSSYTASERRGIIAIGLIILVLIAVGVTVSWYGTQNKEEAPMVVEYPEFIDSVAVKKEQGKQEKKKTGKTKKAKEKKSIRKRSPLDEPV